MNLLNEGNIPTNTVRTSLVGRPINARSNRQDARYRKMQAQIYNFLERPKSWRAISYHVAVFASVFVCLVFSVLSTIEAYKLMAVDILFFIELGMLFWFFTEYCLRMWSAGCRSRYQTWRGRLQFARRPFCIVDIIVIVSSVVVLVVGSDRQMFAASALRGLRFFQILRMIRMDRRGGSWKLLASVVWAHRQELFTTVYIGFLGLIFSSFLIYLVEKDRNENINSYADALWWGVITLCTVGYGDTVPHTPMGRIIASFCAIAGISFFALPAGILGSGFALKVQQHQRQKHLIRRRVPAAKLIQCLWRCYAADPSSNSVATWNLHLKPMRSPNTPHPNRVSSSEKTATFTSRISTIKRRCEEKVASVATSFNNNGNDNFQETGLAQTAGYPTTRRNAVAQLDNISSSEVLLHRKFGIWDEATVGNTSGPKDELDAEEDMMEEAPQKRQLTTQEKNAIRGIRKIKFFVARKVFKEALRPYDLKDVIEQYSSGHVDMLARVKGLQCRLDEILGKSDSKRKQNYDPDVSLLTRIYNTERRVEDIELKIDIFLDLYKQDRCILWGQTSLPSFANDMEPGRSSHTDFSLIPTVNFQDSNLILRDTGNEVSSSNVSERLHISQHSRYQTDLMGLSRSASDSVEQAESRTYPPSIFSNSRDQMPSDLRPPPRQSSRKSRPVHRSCNSANDLDELNQDHPAVISSQSNPARLLPNIESVDDVFFPPTRVVYQEMQTFRSIDSDNATEV